MQATVQEIETTAKHLATRFGGIAVAGASVADAAAQEGQGLTHRESALRDAFRSPRRRAEFVAGRIAARRAITRLLAASKPVALEILKDAAGAPLVVVDPTIRVSISHSNGVAVAVAARVEVGIDLEKDEPRPESFPRLFCSSGEQQTLSTVAGRDRQAMLNTLWSRKEAVSKVGRWGGTVAFAGLDCQGGAVWVEGRSIEVLSAMGGGYVLSIAVEREGMYAHG